MKLKPQKTLYNCIEIQMGIVINILTESVLQTLKVIKIEYKVIYLFIWSTFLYLLFSASQHLQLLRLNVFIPKFNINWIFTTPSKNFRSPNTNTNNFIESAQSSPLLYITIFPASDEFVRRMYVFKRIWNWKLPNTNQCRRESYKNE